MWGLFTCILEIDGKIKIGIDPALCPKGYELSFKGFSSKRISDPKYSESTFENVDIWLITHSHDDHIDSFGVKVMLPSSVVICDKKTEKNEKISHLNRKSLVWGKTFLYKKGHYLIKITAIPAYHGDSWFSRTLVGKVNGYLIEISDSKEQKIFYFTGDTIYHKDVIKQVPQNVDILVANLGNVRNKTLRSQLTMDTAMLNQFMVDLRPKLVIPVHIDDFSHYRTSKEELKRAGHSIIPLGEWIFL